MENSPALRLLLLALCLHVPGVWGRKEDLQEVNAKRRPPHAAEVKGGRCSYTFVVPQQKLKGALCLSTASEASARPEAEALRAELHRQQQQLDTLRARLEQVGGVAAEVRALRRESGGLSGRISQLYAQLLHQVLQKREQEGEQRRVENLLLNATTQVSGEHDSSRCVMNMTPPGDV